MKTAVIYARFSSSHQREESIEGQIRICSDYAAQNNLQIIDHYIDRSISGKTDNRPSFQRMITDALSGRFQVLLVYSTDRFARSKYDSVVYKAALKKAGVDIIYVTEPIPKTSAGMLLECMLEGYAEYYSMELADKVKRGMYDSAKKGKAVHQPPYGYIIGPEQTYIADPKEARAVKEIFEQYAAGVPQAEIIQWLDQHGYKTKRGKAFGHCSFHRMLRNKAYCGEYRHEDIIIKDGMPRIIDDDLFYAVQAEIEKRKGTKIKVNTDYYLSGKLICGQCDMLMTGSSGTSKTGNPYYYYKDKNKHSVRKDWIEDLVYEKSLEYVLEPARFDELFNALEAYASSNTDIEYLRTRLNDLNKRSKALLDNMEREIVPGAAERMREIEDEKEQVQTALISAKNYIPSKKQLKKMLDRWREEGKEKKRVLRDFVKRVYWWPDKLIIVFNYTGHDGEPTKEEILLSSPDGNNGDLITPLDELKVVRSHFILFARL